MFGKKLSGHARFLWICLFVWKGVELPEALYLRWSHTTLPQAYHLSEENQAEGNWQYSFTFNSSMLLNTASLLLWFFIIFVVMVTQEAVTVRSHPHPSPQVPYGFLSVKYHWRIETIREHIDEVCSPFSSDGGPSWHLTCDFDPGRHPAPSLSAFGPRGTQKMKPPAKPDSVKSGLSKQLVP